MGKTRFDYFDFYRRYRWRAQDFTLFQQTLNEHDRASNEGAYGAAVLQGFGLSPSGSGIAISVAAGMCVGPTGDVMAVTGTTVVTVAAPSANSQKHLIVARLVNTPSNYMPRPTAPGDSVPLNEERSCEIVAISGEIAVVPEYPAVEDNDVILGGIILNTGDTVIADQQVETQVRDTLGKNSILFQTAMAFDDRCRAYRSTGALTGIKPAQSVGPAPKTLMFAGVAYPSKFPKDSGGDFNPEDTFLNWTTGAITGGDEVSADFTPTIPSSGEFIWALIALLSDDTLTVSYGTAGTRAECINGLRNQETAGAGSLPTATGFLVAYVLLSSNGSAILDNEVYDARLFGFTSAGVDPGVASGGILEPATGSFPLTLTEGDDGRVVLVDTQAARTINFPSPDPDSGFKVTIKDKTGGASGFPITMSAPGTTQIEGLDADYLCETNYGSWTWVFDGTGYWQI